MLRMQDLTKVYRTHMIETHALRGFDIHVREGEFVTVTGPSGSGKTTFLNIAGLLEEFNGGEYFLDGVSVKGLDDNQQPDDMHRFQTLTQRECGSGQWSEDATSHPHRTRASCCARVRCEEQNK